MSQAGFCHGNKILSYDIKEEECDVSLCVMYYLCLYAKQILIYADQNKM